MTYIVGEKIELVLRDGRRVSGTVYSVNDLGVVLTDAVFTLPDGSTSSTSITSVAFEDVEAEVKTNIPLAEPEPEEKETKRGRRRAGRVR
ncbi:MAG: hypothetical protein QW544_05130 [Candidatus Caldarchaeum sp.]